MVSNRAQPALAVPAYDFTARVLHWVMAALVLAMVPLGIVAANNMGGAMQTPLYNLHKSLGVVVAALIVVRLYWRLTQDRKSTRLNSSHSQQSRMPSSA